jgi:hypothetical protein
MFFIIGFTLSFKPALIMSIADVLAAKTSAGNQRASFTHAQMDAIGGFDDKNQEIGIVVDAEIGEDLEAPINDGSTDVLTTELGDETVEDSNPTPMSVMEISEEADDEESDIDEDLTRLLGDTVASVTQKKQKKGGCCSCKTRIIGNQTIVCGDYFDKTGWGVVGPQWFGPGCVIAIVAWASVHFIRKALGIGPLTTSMCAIFAVATTYNLIDTAFRDPGICMDKVRPANAKNPADYIWCDFCR